ncbi:dipeptidyl-peptidase 3 family protein [Parvularcula maris]|uniref:DNA mismatch repair protein MutT n=1 Tax=Parvularcula maris TaxID=2965077 RepID=A0A9X2L8V8_9PROT|nr:hypothetical protein [Parvularcula maris]MCQ8185157.1 hypothetical protein [Parvularcula maris]
MKRTTKALTLSLLLTAAACGQNGAEAPEPQGEEAVRTEGQSTMNVASTEELQTMRSQFARIEMDPDTSFLTEDERQVVELLNRAGNLMSSIYLRQISPENPARREAILASNISNKEMVLELFDLHFGPWDTLDHNEPFVGTDERPEGAGFYPADLTREEFEAWIAENPGDEEAFTSGYTVIRRTGDGGLEAIPYSVAYAEFLEPAAALLREAAGITKNENLKRFLRLRAESFLSDDYYESELAWMDLDGPIEVAIGPYEVYDDGLFGRKTAFEAFVTVRNPEESAALDKYKGLLRDMETNLPVEESYKNFRRGFESPIAVVDQVHGGGDNVSGVQTIAFNLPNDERVREAKGAKKVLLNNVLGAKFDRILEPMAGKVLVPEQASLLVRKYMGMNTLFHELSHSLGPGVITVDGEETTVNAALQERYSALEEGKADVMGAYNILYMMERGELPAAEKEAFLATYFAGLFRSMRFGIGEAHGQGAAFQYSFYKEAGAFEVDEETKLYRVDFAALEQAIRDLTAKVVMLQGNGDYDAAGAFLDGYGVLDGDAERVIASMTDIPVDIQPVYSDTL